ncbi:MAG: hypothetical protein WBM00_05660 [Solirubrobacterales bacterium]
MATPVAELKRLFIAGAGGFGGECEQWLMTRGVKVHNYLDDDNPACIRINDYRPKDGDQVLVAISDPKGREQVVKRLKERGAVFHGMLFHICPPSAKIGGGVVSCPYSAVSAFAKVGDFCHINLLSTVGHHVTLGDFCTLSCHVDLTGHVTVGRGVYFGSGARVLPRVSIGDYATIGAGAVVVSDVPAGATIYAQPGRML